jgi:hypothetical protein
VASYYGDPQLAKKDPAKIFTDDGGSFSKILQSGLTAEKFKNAFVLSKIVGNEVEKFKIIKRKRYSSQEERKAAYSTGIGSFVLQVFDDLDAAIPQITIFAISLIFDKHVNSMGKNLDKVITDLQNRPDEIWQSFIDLIRAKNALASDKSWPTLLKSGTFYRDVIKFMEGDWKS